MTDTYILQIHPDVKHMRNVDLHHIAEIIRSKYACIKSVATSVGVTAISFHIDISTMEEMQLRIVISRISYDLGRAIQCLEDRRYIDQQLRNM